MGVRVLVAGDSPVVQQAIKRLLESSNVHVVEAEKLADAVRLAEQARPDVIVLDYSKRITKGIDAARALRQVRPDVRVILLTTTATEYDIASALGAGVCGFVLKADAGDDLIRAVRHVLDGGTFVSPSASRALYEPYLPRKSR